MDMPFGKTVDLMVFDALYEIFYGYHMGITAENIAARYAISREEQDKLSLESHTRARNAIKSGLLKDEIVPVTIPQKKGNPIVFDTDERPMETSMEKLAKLGTAFKKDGTVTAGNASGINDAAAALLIMSEDKAKQMGLKPLARIKGYASGGVDPAYMGLGPVPAVRKLLRITGTSVKDYVFLNSTKRLPPRPSPACASSIFPGTSPTSTVRPFPSAIRSAAPAHASCWRLPMK
jgi:acetyl-CoA C-acetyltransferase